MGKRAVNIAREATGHGEKRVPQTPPRILPGPRAREKTGLNSWKRNKVGGNTPEPQTDSPTNEEGKTLGEGTEKKEAGKEEVILCSLEFLPIRKPRSVLIKRGKGGIHKQNTHGHGARCPVHLPKNGKPRPEEGSTKQKRGSEPPLAQCPVFLDRPRGKKGGTGSKKQLRGAPRDVCNGACPRCRRRRCKG